MAAQTESFTEVFSLIVSIAERDGVKAINQFPGCWERDLADGWAFSVNGKGVELADKRGVAIPVYRAAIYHKESFLGFVDPYGGTLVAGVEDELIVALKEALSPMCVCGLPQHHNGLLAWCEAGHTERLTKTDPRYSAT